MAVAKLYPEAEHGGVRVKGESSILNILGSKQYLSWARTVLHWSPPLADLVLTGTKPLKSIQAMAVAIAHPEPEKGGRGKKRLLEVNVSDDSTMIKMRGTDISHIQACP